MSFLFKNSLVNVIYLFIRCYNTRFVLSNTNDTDRNGVNKTQTHTHTHTHTHACTYTCTHTKHSEKDITGKG